MKLKIFEVAQLWQGINAIYQVNDLLPGPFDYHMIKRNVPILQKEVENLQELDDDEFEEIKDTEIELPLSRIKPDMLPDKMPKGALSMIDCLIINQEQPEHQSAVAKLLEGQKNGKKEEKTASANFDDEPMWGDDEEDA